MKTRQIWKQMISGVRKVMPGIHMLGALSLVIAGNCLVTLTPIEVSASDRLAYLTIQNNLGDAGSYLQAVGTMCTSYNSDCSSYSTPQIPPQNQNGTGIQYYKDMSLIVARKQNGKSVDFSHTPQCTAKGDMFVSYRSCTGVTLSQTQSKKGYVKYSITNSGCDGVFIVCH